jgi:ribosomal protein S18 acetylase RimI-like enzyme
MPMIIRKATIRDFGKLKEIKSEFFLWACSRDELFDPAYAKNGLPQRLGKNLRQGNTAFFVADDKGRFAGYIGVCLMESEAESLHKKRGHIFNLYVRPGYRKRGIAKKLIAAAFAWLRKKKTTQAIIRTQWHNRLAWRLYKKSGFGERVVELRK